MIRKLGPLALILALVAVFAVGCGDDDKSSDSSNDTPAVTTAADDTATDDAATEEDATEEDSSSGDADAGLQAGIDACKDSVDSNPQVTDDLKDDIKAICESIDSTDPDEMQRVSREVCEKIVEKSVPAGSARDQALEACAAAGG